MKEFLTKKIGPFKGGEWLIIGIAGIGLGLLIRKRGRVGTETEPEPATIIGSAQPPIIASGTNYNQGEIVSDVIDALSPRFQSIEQRLPPTTSSGGGGVDPTTGDVSDGRSPSRVGLLGDGQIQWINDGPSREYQKLADSFGGVGQLMDGRV